MIEHSTRIRIRFGETDKTGVVYHPNYLVYFEIGRTDMLRTVGLVYSELESKGSALVVTEAGVKYRKSVHYDEEILIKTRAIQVRHASLHFEYRAEKLDGTLVANGFTWLGCVGEDQKPNRLPPEVRELLAPYTPS